MSPTKQTHCKHGHAFNSENTYTRPSNGKRACRICLRNKSTAWRQKNPKKVKKYLQEWYKENKESVRVQKSRWSEDNLEKERTRKRRIAKDNPQWGRKAARKRRALKNSQLGFMSEFEYQLIPMMRFLQGGRCYYCKSLISIDLSPQDPLREILEHPYPLSRGGTHGIENWVLSCFKCNARKGNKTAAEFLENLNG